MNREALLKLLKNTELSRTARLVAAYAVLEGGTFTAQQLAADLGISRDAVGRALQELAAVGIAVKGHRKDAQHGFNRPYWEFHDLPE